MGLNVINCPISARHSPVVFFSCQRDYAFLPQKLATNILWLLSKFWQIFFCEKHPVVVLEKQHLCEWKLKLTINIKKFNVTTQEFTIWRQIIHYVRKLFKKLAAVSSNLWNFVLKERLNNKTMLLLSKCVQSALYITTNTPENMQNRGDMWETRNLMWVTLIRRRPVNVTQCWRGEKLIHVSAKATDKRAVCMSLSLSHKHTICPPPSDFLELLVSVSQKQSSLQI